jgi:hypothetical protein
MCGIIGYIGPKDVVPVLIDGTTPAHSGTRSVHVSSLGNYQTFPALRGIYIYADFAVGTIWGLRYQLSPPFYVVRLMRVRERGVEDVMDSPLWRQLQLERGLTFSNYLQDFEWHESFEVKLPGGLRRGNVPAI